LSFARIAVPRHKLHEILQALPAGAEWWTSPGIGIVHWSITGGAAAVRDARATAESAGGSLVIMAGPDSLRQEVGAWGSPPPTLELMKRLKHAFDPQRTLNPGRFVV
jgi:FAD/FMN-containing dehydrogenase